MNTVGSILRKYHQEFKKQGLEEFVVDFFLADILKLDTTKLFAHEDDELSSDNLKLFEEYCFKYVSKIPAEYVISKAYFYGYEFYIDNRVLIPRNETEELVELMLKNNKEEKLTILDMCSGSGCIGLTIKKQRPNYHVYLSDISKDCIDVIRINKNKLGVNVDILQGDLFEPVINQNIKFDILVCNPPYIALNDEYVDESTKYEPSRALYTNDPKGLEFYQRIFDFLSNYEFKKAYFEFGFKQKEDLEELLSHYKFKYRFYNDYSGKNRMLEIIK